MLNYQRVNPRTKWSNVCLVGGIPTPLKNYESRMIIPNIWKNKIHVPNKKNRFVMLGDLGDVSALHSPCMWMRVVGTSNLGI